MSLSRNLNQDQVCYFYSKGKHCSFGRDCKFLHIRDSVEGTDVQDGSPISSKHQIPVVVEETENSSTTKSSQHGNLRNCIRFLKFGSCRFGRNCRYRHVRGDESLKSIKSQPNKQNNQNEDIDQQSVDDKKVVEICNFYLYKGHCKFGDKCRFSHTVNEESDSVQNGATGNGQQVDLPEDDANGGAKQQTDKKRLQPKHRRVCRYFKNGNCSLGDRCRFWHPEFLENAKPKEAPKGPRTPHVPSKEFVLSELSDEDLEKHRDTEIAQLKKRFPKADDVSSPKFFGFDFVFVPTDPDWPFDVKKVEITALFSKVYPKKRMLIKVKDNDVMPETLRRYIEKSCDEWLVTRFEACKEAGKVELIFRPFLRWLDKNLEDLFTKGLTQYQKELIAKASGIEFKTAHELREEYGQHEEDSDDEDDEVETGDSDNEEELSTEGEATSSEDETEGDGSGNKRDIVIDPSRKGTEVKLVNLQLTENATTLSVDKLKLVLQCSRCKNNTDVLCVGGQPNMVMCVKCSHNMLVTFRPSISHQFTSVIGYLDLDGCAPFDAIMMDCIFNVGCFNCNKEAAIGGLSPGQVLETWCRACHKKLKIAAEYARFQQLAPSQPIDLSGAVVVDVKKIKKIPKDPLIKEGQALPEFGTCKHYKKSYRWFRFPCCGKTYPCDVCHDADADHDMKYANRMICGFCCREQPYAADKPCIGCNSNMTKKITSHWEGGAGCRDKTKMSRNDKKKFSNSKKTISRKAKEKSQPKKKKSQK